MSLVWLPLSLTLWSAHGYGAERAAPAQREAVAEASPSADAAPAALDGHVVAYVEAAAALSPELRAAYLAWSAEVHAIRGAGAPPDPTIGVMGFPSAVETRVGPQLARLSLQQTLPWPSELVGRHDAAVARARTAEARYHAVGLAVSAEVVRRYWALWEARASADVLDAQLAVLEDLSASVRARLEAGGASLADLQQVDLMRSRLVDRRATVDAGVRRAAAALRAAVGAPGDVALPTVDAPATPSVPSEPLDALTAKALAHPDLATAEGREEAAAAAIRVARGRRAPGLSVGLDWVITGPAVMSGQADSGKDAVMVGVGFRVPLWQAAYADDVRAATAGREARAADVDALRLRLEAAVEDAWLRVTDGARRVRVVQRALLPQAETAYASLLGGVAVGRASMAQVLLAQRDLLDLRLQAVQEQAALEVAWADLEQRCGAAVARQEEAP